MMQKGADVDFTTKAQGRKEISLLCHDLTNINLSQCIILSMAISIFVLQIQLIKSCRTEHLISLWKKEWMDI